MKSTHLGAIILVVLFGGTCMLGGCCRDDCADLMQLSFRAVDQSGRDLVSTLNVPVDSIKIETKSGTRLGLFQVFADPAYLTVSISPGESEYILKYDHRQTTINVTPKVIDKSRCCGDSHGIDELTASSGDVDTESSPNRKETIYIIKL